MPLRYKLLYPVVVVESGDTGEKLPIEEHSVINVIQITNKICTNKSCTHTSNRVTEYTFFVWKCRASFLVKGISKRGWLNKLDLHK